MGALRDRAAFVGGSNPKAIVFVGCFVKRNNKMVSGSNQGCRPWNESKRMLDSPIRTLDYCKGTTKKGSKGCMTESGLVFWTIRGPMTTQPVF